MSNDTESDLVIEGFAEAMETIEEEASDGLPEGFAEALKLASKGQFEITMFEAWEQVLNKSILDSSERLSLQVADGIMRQWPWLAYHDLPSYLTLRVSQLKRALVILQECFPKDPAILFTENEDDFEEHKDAYIDVIVAWRKFANKLHDEWEATPITSKMKGVIHAATADTVALLIHPRNGLVENLSGLAGFNISDEEIQEMAERIDGETDE